MRGFFVTIAGLFLTACLAAPAALAADAPRIAPPAPWVNAVAIPKADRARGSAPVQILITARQDYFGRESLDNFVETAMLIQTAEGLANANIAIPWQPDHSELVIHHLKIIRGDEAIDVLANQTFTVLRREPNLEIAMLDGVMTAALQPEGLRVGDILNLAWTIKYSNPLFQNHASQIIPNITDVEINELRLRQVWPDDREMRWQASPVLPKPKTRKTRHGNELVFSLKNIEPQTPPLGAPPRYSLAATLETTEFKSWSEISTLFEPIFADASRLEPDSPLKAEAQKIAAQTSNKKRRAELALKLVQDQIRYVFVGIESGGYVPVKPDKTWSRRFGDCKAKTVLLIALLNELGIDAEPALVSTVFGDDLVNRLPVIGLFDHVIVRTDIDGKEYWLDGTRFGDVSFDYMQVSAFPWALPLRTAGAELTKINRTPPQEPNYIIEIDINASRGLDKLAPTTAKLTFRGDTAILLSTQLNSLPKEQRSDHIKAMWQVIGVKDIDDPPEMSYDEATGDLSFSMRGTFKVSSSTTPGGTLYRIPHAAFGWDSNSFTDNNEKRKAPWLLPFPAFEKVTTTITLPNKGDGYRLDEDHINFSYGGFELSRSIAITGDQLKMGRTTKITRSEISADDAKELKSRLSEIDTATATFTLHGDPLQEISAASPETNSPTRDNAKLEYADDYIERGVTLLDQEQFDTAYADFDKAVETEPGSSWGYANRGVASFHLKNYGSARGDFEKALSINEENYVALRGMGMILGNEEDFEGALNFFSRSIASRTDNDFARKNRAVAYASMGRYDDALVDIESVLSANSGDHLLLSLKAQVLLASKKPEDALAAVSKAISLAPDVKKYREQRTQISGVIDQHKRSLTELNQKIIETPDDADLYEYRCWYRMTRNFELDEALADCNRAVDLDPKNSAAHNSRGFVHLRARRFSEAMADFDIALAILPTLPAPLYGRGVARLQRGDKSGQTDIDAALALDPEIAMEFADYGVTVK